MQENELEGIEKERKGIMYATTMTIVPEVAKKMLATSIGNRKIRKDVVDRYAYAMQRGEFTLTDSAICFDVEGHLRNGHHRLNACVEADAPFDALVAYDLPLEAIMDRGLVRSTGDALCMAGKLSEELSDTQTIAVAKSYLRSIDFKFSSYDMKICDFVNDHGQQIKDSIRISGSGKTSGICRKSACQAAFVAAMIMGVPNGTIEKFATVVNTGMPEDQSQYSAVVLRNFLLVTKMRGKNEIKKTCAFTQLALRDFVAGVPRKQAYKKLSFPYMPEAKPIIRNDKKESAS